MEKRVMRMICIKHLIASTPIFPSAGSESGNYRLYWNRAQGFRQTQLAKRLLIIAQSLNPANIQHLTYYDFSPVFRKVFIA